MGGLLRQQQQLQADGTPRQHLARQTGAPGKRQHTCAKLHVTATHAARLVCLCVCMQKGLVLRQAFGGVGLFMGVLKLSKPPAGGIACDHGWCIPPTNMLTDVQPQWVSASDVDHLRKVGVAGLPHQVSVV